LWEIWDDRRQETVYVADTLKDAINKQVELESPQKWAYTTRNRMVGFVSNEDDFSADLDEELVAA
jgi:23S rRNA maturation-related 3'-5' exoribonuclease YhaM